MAHFTLIGYCFTPDKHISFVFSSSSRFSDLSLGFSLIIPKKSSTISFASFSFLPLIKSVIIDAEAIEIAQPLPSNEISSIEDISFEGSGCAISMASASIMTDLIKGKNENEAKEIVEDFLGMIKENPKLKSENLEEDEKTKLMCLSGVKQYPMRVKCATLSWHTLVSAFDNKTDEVKTEN